MTADAPEPSPAPPPAPPRDRDATARRILDAARDILVETGAHGLRVNAVARRAGCDKQLIYRYFGGPEGLAEALGAELAERWAAGLEAPAEAPAATSYAALMEALAARLIGALRADPVLRSTLLWELSDGPSPAAGRIAEAKSLALGAWIQRARGPLAPPPGLDAPALNALLVGGVIHAALAAAASGRSVGMELQSDADWARLEAALRALIRAAFAAPA